MGLTNKRLTTDYDTVPKSLRSPPMQRRGPPTPADLMVARAHQALFEARMQALLDKYDKDRNVNRD